MTEQGQVGERMRYRPTDRQTDQPTDTAYYRDARTHLKINWRLLKQRLKQGQKEIIRGI